MKFLWACLLFLQSCTVRGPDGMTLRECAEADGISMSQAWGEVIKAQFEDTNDLRLGHEWPGWQMAMSAHQTHQGKIPPIYKQRDGLVVVFSKSDLTKTEE